MICYTCLKICSLMHNCNIQISIILWKKLWFHWLLIEILTSMKPTWGLWGPCHQEINDQPSCFFFQNLKLVETCVVRLSKCCILPIIGGLGWRSKMRSGGQISLFLFSRSRRNKFSNFPLILCLYLVLANKLSLAITTAETILPHTRWFYRIFYMNLHKRMI